MSAAPTSPVTAPYVTVAHQRLRVDIRPGLGVGPPLLVCGGIGASLEVLQPLVDALDPAVEIIRFDAPGIGGSPAARLPWGFPHLAWLLRRLLDELGYHRVDVLGYSWGGALAQQFALQFPGRCRRVVLVSTNTGMLAVPGHLRVLSEMLTPRYFQDADDAVSVVRVLDDDPRTAAQDPRSRPSVAATHRADAGLGYLQQLAAVSAWTSLPFLPWIRQPVLIMHGDDDPIVPTVNAHIMANLLPHAIVQIVPGGHAAIITAATDFALRIARFLSAREPGR